MCVTHSFDFNSSMDRLLRVNLSFNIWAIYSLGHAHSSLLLFSSSLLIIVCSINTSIICVNFCVICVLREHGTVNVFVYTIYNDSWKITTESNYIATNEVKTTQCHWQIVVWLLYCAYVCVRSPYIFYDFVHNDNKTLSLIAFDLLPGTIRNFDFSNKINYRCVFVSIQLQYKFRSDGCSRSHVSVCVFLTIWSNLILAVVESKHFFEKKIDSFDVFTHHISC